MLPLSFIVRISILLVLWLAILAPATAQDGADTVVITSPDRHVTLDKGASVTLKTVAAPTPLAPESSVPAGHMVQATLERKITGKDVKVGDPVHLSVLYPFHFQRNGKTVRVPQKAAVHGHITHVAERSEGNGRAELAFAVDRLEYDGESVALNAVVLEVHPTGAPPGLHRRTEESASRTNLGREWPPTNRRTQ